MGRCHTFTSKHNPKGRGKKLSTVTTSVKCCGHLSALKQMQHKALHQISLAGGVCVARPAPAFDWPHQTCLPAPVSLKNFFSLLVTLAISAPSMSLKARHSLCYPPELTRQGLLMQTGKTSTSLVSLN